MPHFMNLFMPNRPDGKRPEIEKLPYRPAPIRNDPLLGIGTFAPEFWRLVAEPVPKPFTAEVPSEPTPRSPHPASPPNEPVAPMEEITVTARRPVRHLTDDQIANIVFNETVSLTGPDVQEMRRQMAQTIMNAEEAFGRERRGAKTAPFEITRAISPVEQKRLQQIRDDVVAARARFERGEDPTGFATNFMKREDTGGPPSLAPPKGYGDGFRLAGVHGPFPDSQRNNEPAKHVYFWQNPSADKYYGRNR